MKTHRLVLVALLLSSAACAGEGETGSVGEVGSAGAAAGAIASGGASGVGSGSAGVGGKGAGASGTQSGAGGVSAGGGGGDAGAAAGVGGGAAGTDPTGAAGLAGAAAAGNAGTAAAGNAGTANGGGAGTAAGGAGSLCAQAEIQTACSMAGAPSPACCPVVGVLYDTKLGCVRSSHNLICGNGCPGGGEVNSCFAVTRADGHVDVLYTPGDRYNGADLNAAGVVKVGCNVGAYEAFPPCP